MGGGKKIVLDKEMEVLAIIPARGGSKSIPRKNIMPFHGRPLIAWSIEAAKSSLRITRIITSTDDEEIANVAREFGSEVPFLRPAKLAQDATIDHPVFKHALEWLQANEGYEPEIVVNLRPTTPLRPSGIVDQGIDLLLADESADSVRCVCEPHNNPYKMWKIAQGGHMVPLFESGIEEQYNQPRQLLPDCYWQTGAVDIVRSKVIIENESMSGSKILPLIIDNKYAVDIDDEASLNFANYAISKYGMFPE